MIEATRDTRSTTAPMEMGAWKAISLAALGRQPFGGLGVVARVGGHEDDGVARLGLDEGGLEHHGALLAAVEHLDLDRLGEGGAPDQGERGGEGNGLDTHLTLLQC